MRSSLMLTTVLSAAASLLLGVAQAGAQDEPTTQPTRMYYPPSPYAIGVMVLPFRQIDPTPEGQPISQAIDQNFQIMARNPLVRLISPPTDLPLNTGDALQDGLDAQAKYVVYGTYTVADNQVTVSGSLISVADGRTAKPLSASGPLSDLSQVEDSLFTQVVAVLPAPPSEPAPVPVFVNGAPQADQPASSGFVYLGGGGDPYAGDPYFSGIYVGGLYGGYGGYYGGGYGGYSGGRSHFSYGNNRGFHTAYQNGVPRGIGIGAPALGARGFYGGIRGGGRP
ncbi:MAG: hypothetical protein ABSH22_16685 [Tepidisphaeraceae bacterium]